jgi:hypothetical protein
MGNLVLTVGLLRLVDLEEPAVIVQRRGEDWKLPEIPETQQVHRLALPLIDQPYDLDQSMSHPVVQFSLTGAGLPAFPFPHLNQRRRKNTSPNFLARSYRIVGKETWPIVSTCFPFPINDLGNAIIIYRVVVNLWPLESTAFLETAEHVR